MLATTGRARHTLPGDRHASDDRPANDSETSPGANSIWLVSLLLEGKIAITVLTALIVAAPLMVIPAAQLHALATTGQWRGFQVSKLLDVLQVAPETPSTHASSVAGFALALLASLVLFTAILALCVLAAIFPRANRRGAPNITASSKTR